MLIHFIEALGVYENRKWMKLFWYTTSNTLILLVVKLERGFFSLDSFAFVWHTQGLLIWMLCKHFGFCLFQFFFWFYFFSNILIWKEFFFTFFGIVFKHHQLQQEREKQWKFIFYLHISFSFRSIRVFGFRFSLSLHDAENDNVNIQQLLSEIYFNEKLYEQCERKFLFIIQFNFIDAMNFAGRVFFSFVFYCNMISFKQVTLSRNWFLVMRLFYVYVLLSGLFFNDRCELWYSSLDLFKSRNCKHLKTTFSQLSDEK